MTTSNSLGYFEGESYRTPTTQECRQVKIEGTKRRLQNSNQSPNLNHPYYEFLPKIETHPIQRDLTTSLNLH